MVKVIGLDFETALKRFVPVMRGKSVVVGQQVPISYQLYSEDVKLNPKSKQPSVFGTILERLENYFSRRTVGSIFVSANLCFDTAILTQILSNKNVSITCYYSKSRPIKTIIQDQHGRKWKIIDLFNIYGRIGLGKIGQLVGLEKLSKPKWLGIRPPLNSQEWEYLKQYGIRDAQIHYLGYKKICDFWGITPYTSGGLALKHFKKHSGFRFKFPRFKEEVLKKWGNAYRGGRSECFVRGSVFGKVYYYDVNALYPYVMTVGSFPLISKEKDGMYVKKHDVNLDREGIAKVIIYQDHDIPPLGVKRNVSIKLPKLGKTFQPRLVFPRGMVCDWFTYPELRYLEQSGHGFVVKVLEAYEWKYSFNPFKNWISSLLEVREKNPQLKYLVKIPLNSLYGKLGERRCSRVVQIAEGKVVKVYPDLNSSIVYAKHSCLPWAAYITALGRLHLHNIIKKCNYDIYYCDTDSVFTSRSLDTSGKMGELGIKYQTESDAQSVFIRSKFYIVGDLVRCRGWNSPPPAHVVKAMLLSDKLEVEQVCFASVLQACRLNVPPATQLTVKKIITTGEDGKRLYVKRIDSKELLTDMSESEPLALKEGWFK
ncbi:MAG: DNA polymerase [Candidatus Aenigmatarchaeota archaeon]